MRVVLQLFAVTLLASLAIPAPADGRDRRSHELVDYVCESEIGRRQVTLFANGTIRVRDGIDGEETMYLGELTPDELRAYRNRLDGVDLTESRSTILSAQGAWVEACRLEIERPDGEVLAFEMARYDALPLGLSNAVRIVEEMSGLARPVQQFELPLDYEPRLGDVLRRNDDELFQIIAYTTNGLGVELQGVHVPVTIYSPISELRSMFKAIESRRSGR